MVRVRAVSLGVELEATRAVRHEVYGREKGFLQADEVIDPFDHRATVLNAYECGKPVASVRLIDSSKHRPELFDMHPELQTLVSADTRYLEISRLTVLKSHRGFHVTLPLFRRIAGELRASGAEGMLVSCAEGLVPYYRDLFGFRLLSPVPLTHHRLRGLKDYAMAFEFSSYALDTPLKVLVSLFARGPIATLRHLLRTK
jgi:hypothetical protein